MTNRHRVSLFAAAGAAVFLLAAPAAQASCMGMAKGGTTHDQTADLQIDRSVQKPAAQTPAPTGEDALRRDEDATVAPVEITGAERTRNDTM